MAGITETVFSEVEVRRLGIKFPDTQKADVNECIGNAEEEMEVKTVTKKCRGVVTKSRTKGTGKGTLKITGHVQQDVFASMYGMEQTGLKEGVIAYGMNSLHPVVCITMEVLDEDDNKKYKAYPQCTIQSALARKIEAGTEEIAEIELEITIMPDEYGNGLYEAVESDLKDEDLKTKWMEEFTSKLVQTEEA